MLTWKTKSICIDLYCICEINQSDRFIFQNMFTHYERYARKMKAFSANI